MELKTSRESGPSYTLELKVYLDQLDCLFKNYKADTPYREKTWNDFEDYQPEHKRKIIENAKVYLEICSATINSGGSLDNGKQLLWFALRKLGLLPSDDLFDGIDDTGVIEIYDMYNTQVFRNLNFFDICSYGFAEIFIYPWNVLFKRDTSVDSAIFKHAELVFSGKLNSSLIVDDIPFHLMEELFSPEMFVMNMQEGMFSPLKNKSGVVTHAVATSNVEVIEKRKDIDLGIITSDRKKGLWL